jgi:hypothetical protein
MHYDGPVTLPRAIALGGLTVGVLDALDAIVFFGLRGVAPVRIFQSIASGLIGPAAFRGGVGTDVLGVVLHFTVASLIVTVLCLLARKWPALVRHAAIAAPLYGISAWIVMNYVVIPLSAASRGRMALPVVVNGLLIHIFGVGLPAVLAARSALPLTVRRQRG